MRQLIDNKPFNVSDASSGNGCNRTMLGRASQGAASQSLAVATRFGQNKRFMVVLLTSTCLGLAVSGGTSSSAFAKGGRGGYSVSGEPVCRDIDSGMGGDSFHAGGQPSALNGDNGYSNGACVHGSGGGGGGPGGQGGQGNLFDPSDPLGDRGGNGGNGGANGRMITVGGTVSSSFAGGVGRNGQRGISTSYSVAGGGGGAGGYGLIVTDTTDTVVVTGTMTGGAAGSGGTATGLAGAGDGGDGGIGVYSEKAAIINRNVIAGGVGGAGGVHNSGGIFDGTSGEGGAGGDGIFAETAITVSNDAQAIIRAGNGADGGAANESQQYAANNGGKGGDGISGALNIVNNGSISAGNGGGGGALGRVASTTYSFINYGGNGGAGGTGIRFEMAGATISSSVSIAGGAGGAAGAVGNANQSSGFGNGGAGGAGILTGAGATVTNSGVVIGGDGATGADMLSSKSVSNAGNGGAGGTAIDVGTGSIVINSGTIAAGKGGAAGNVNATGDVSASGQAGADGMAIHFRGQGHLTLMAGSNITGLVVNDDSTGQIELSGAGDFTFSGGMTSQINQTGSQYQGFNTLENTGSGTVIVTGSNIYSGVTTLTGGTLSISAQNSLGSGGSEFRFNGGTLQITGTNLTQLNRTINWNANGGGFDIADAGNTFTLSQDLQAGGKLVKSGAGTLVLSGTNLYTGGTDLLSGTLSVASDTNLGDAMGALRFSGGTLSVTDNIITARSLQLSTAGGTLAVANGKSYQLNSAVSDLGSANGALTKSGDGTLILSANNSYSGGTNILGGTLQLGDGTSGHDGMIIGDIVNNSRLVVANVNDTAFESNIIGTGSLTQSGSGVLTLSGNNDYTGGTYLLAGTVSVAQEENLGNRIAALNFDGGTLQVTGTGLKHTAHPINWGNHGGGFDIFDANNTFTVASAFSGTGALTKTGAGALVLTADSSLYSGAMDVKAGDLRLHGAKLGGTLQVEDQADLGGDGTISGAASFASGATLFGQTGQKLFFGNGLTLAAGSQTDVTLTGGPSTNALFDVTGDLSLDGKLNVKDGSVVGAGVYRIFDYSGNLTNNVMAIGTVADGNVSDYSLQTSITHEVNLINTGGRHFFFWDGSQMSGDGTVHGGDGTWNNANSNWTSADGTANTPWFDDTFAVFGGPAGTGGTVTLDGGFKPSVNGMQFMNDGYVLTGGSLNLAGTGDQLILVGDGSLQSSSMTATIAASIKGNEGLLKSGAGQLVLSGANSYNGTTTVTEGLLTLGDGGSLDASSNIVLANTRYGTGNFAINKNTDFTLLNQISGLGEVYKRGTGITTFSGDNSFAGGLSVEAGTAKAGIADHAFGSGLVKIADGAILDLADLNETIGGLDGLNPADGHGIDGNITLGSGALTLNQDLHGDYSGVISGSGGIVKNGAGDLVLYGANSYAGITNVTAGELVQGAQGGFSQASSYQVQDGAELDLSGFATGMAGLQNGGRVSFGGTGGTVLTINGDYGGTGGTLMMSTVLSDDSAQTDQLVITGNSSGNSKVSISNRGGLGAQTVNGIKIIDVGGQSDGDFALNGDYTTKDGQQAIMTASAYAYTLQNGSGSGNKDGNWYLVSQNTRATDPTDPTNPTNPTDPTDPTGPRYSAAAPIYESYGSTLQALNRLPTLQQRVGDRYLDKEALLPSAHSSTDSTQTGETTPAGIWGRIEGAHNRIQSGSTAGDLNQNINTVILQAGIDGQFYEDEQGRLIAGITGQYGNAHARVDNLTGDGSGEINTQGWGLGATATFYGKNGFYLDAQAEANWYDSDLDVDAVNRGLVHSNKGFGYALSLEAGQRITLNESWSLTPQAQLMWSSVDFDSFTDAYSARISSRAGDSLTGRIGMAANYQNSFTGADGRKVDTSVYGIANLYQVLIGENRIDYAGTRMATDDDRSWGGIGMGGTYQWADAKYALYGEATINTALNHFADSYTIKGNLGFKVRW